jgi:transcriptional regulator with XRE-family HTH domain
MIHQGRTLKAARVLAGLEQPGLAAAAGIHRNSVTQWEGRETFPRPEPRAVALMRSALLSFGVHLTGSGIELVVSAPMPTDMAPKAKPEQIRAPASVDIVAGPGALQQPKPGQQRSLAQCMEVLRQMSIKAGERPPFNAEDIARLKAFDDRPSLPPPDRTVRGAQS